MISFHPRSFSTKLLILFVVVVATAQFATYFVVSRENRVTARSLIKEDLANAATVFARVIADRNDILASGASAAAGDYAYKPLFAASVSDDADVPTLVSALNSIRLRIGADVVAFLNLDGQTVANTAPEAAGAIMQALAARADADPSSAPRATGYGYIDYLLHSFVTVPVRAPDVVGWLVVGFRIDDAFAHRLRELTSVEVSFADQDRQILASTLSPRLAAALSDALPEVASRLEIAEVNLGDDPSLVATRHLPAGDQLAATLALQYSLSEKLRPARHTERILLLVACSGLALAAVMGLGFARRLSRPVEALAEHTRIIASGDYATRIELHRSDELGRLADSFNAMSAGLAERDRVRDLLDKNVSPEVAAQLLRDGAVLGGEEREITVLFVDLRGFTPLSEKLPPRELIALLNRYLDRMSAEIERHGGVIDKFIGDAIMALFGAPVHQTGHADHAVAAALAMQDALVELNRDLAAEASAQGESAPPTLQLGIGLNTARVIAGNIGSQRRLNYSVIGDGVNVASRLQALTRTPEYRTNIVISAATRDACRTPIPGARDLGAVVVKGRIEPVAIFAVG